jgi:ribonuclease HI
MAKAIPSTSREIDVGKFMQWVRQHGGEVMTLTTEWMVARYRFGGKGAHVVYRNAKERLRWLGEAAAHYEDMLKGCEPRTEARATIAGRRQVTLYTDASNYHTTKAGAWGAVLVLPGSEYEASGPLKGDIKSSTAAEAKAVANALHEFARLRLIQPGDVVTIVCDNTAVVDRIHAGTNSKRREIQSALVYARGLAERCQFKLRGRWVKGHQPATAGGDAIYNRRCDKLAGAHSALIHAERKEP